MPFGPQEVETMSPLALSAPKPFAESHAKDVPRQILSKFRT